MKTHLHKVAKLLFSFTISTSLPLGGLGWALTSCSNADQDFPDFDYQTIYFAYQTPIRTLTMGDDEQASTELDNQHRCQILATLGGVNSNKKDRQLTIAIDDDLCRGLTFSDGSAVRPMPAAYYTLSSNTATIRKGEIRGGVELQLTDAFFADPLSKELTYVIPLRIVSASDSILQGKDYVLYAVKYKNKYHGCWLSRGIDVLTTGAESTTTEHMPQHWEEADLVYLTTESLTEARYEVSNDFIVVNDQGRNTIEHLTCSLLLTFDEADRCTISTDTPGCTVTGSGQWKRQGAAKAWGDKDRDQLTLQYEVAYTYTSAGQSVTTTRHTGETLVMRDRQNKFETF